MGTKRNDLETVVAQAIQAYANVITKQVAEIIYDDPHQWGDRPCNTCNAISRLLQLPFGCDRYRQQGKYAERADYALEFYPEKKEE